MNGNRMTTRYSTNFSFPVTASRVQSHVIGFLGLSEYIIAPFNQGMIADIALPGDTCYMHTDRVWKEGFITMHCNIYLSNFTGGEAIVENTVIKLSRGDMLVYPVSIVNHGSLKVQPPDARLLWTFGFCISDSEYQRIFSILPQCRATNSPIQ